MVSVCYCGVCLGVPIQQDQADPVLMKVVETVTGETDLICGVQVEVPHAFACADGMVYNVTEWVLCQVDLLNLFP